MPKWGASALAFLLAVGPAQAFVPTPVGGHPGEVDASARITLGRGKLEPNEDPNSTQPASFNVYTLAVGYTTGDLAFLQDVRFGLEVSYLDSPAEVNDPARALVPAGSCLGRVVGAGLCQFHAGTTATLITPTLSFNLLHTGDFSFGLYAQGTIPLGLDLAKFSIPRVDAIAGGTQLGIHLTPWLSFENRTFVGAGARSSSVARQNPAVASTTLLGFEARRWILPWRAGIKAGIFFEGDMQKRFDETYDAAYTAGYPARRERVQSLRFATVLLPYFNITEHAAVEGGYIQKMFGYKPEATVFLYGGLRVAL